MKAIELEKAYNPKDFEDRVYSAWETGGHFQPKSGPESPFVVVIPPPNVTGVLHMGHGLNNSLQDIVVRYHRMRGEPTLWVPGTDHAGIATQNVVEKRLKKEGKSRHDLGREAFVERTWEVKKEHHETITRQLRKIGASVDWTRERFTLDEGLSRSVREVFVTLYERGLIYRGNYLVNWCTSCGTALADDEVEHEDTNGAMYHIWYELEAGSALPDGSTRIEIATTRPETLLGDTAVAVHPEDERYASLIGKHVHLPLTGRMIPIVADTYVDRTFGTGMVKITPAHDPNDWEVSKRHNLPVINILNPDGTLNAEVPEKYRGLKCPAARKAVIEDLKELGLFKEEKKITHAVGKCYRCNTVVEPYLSDQWFVKMRPLADKALDAWKKGEIRFYPQKWENTYSRWMEGIRDWCISRQLWWGHRIPVWYCRDCGEMIVSRDDPASCSKCGSAKIEQDSDVLDTWFSSWLWPFSTLGWPEKTPDLESFYPTTALVTAYDIIFFWVARMVMAGLEFTGKAPFRDIYIHGLVRDKQGRKMSKSLGNGIDPLEIVDEFGADALKFTLAFMCAAGQDILVDKESFKMGSRFANKIWNASRYILGNLEGRELVSVPKSGLTELDRWIYHRLNAAAGAVRSALESYRYNDGAQAIYEFFWNDFCDWYVEATKLSFRNGDDAEKNRAVSVLLSVLEESLRLVHPFLPFVTEEIYGFLPAACARSADDSLGLAERASLLISASYPESNENRCDEAAEARFTALQEMVRSIRGLRVECGIDPASKIGIALFTEAGSDAAVAREKVDILQMLAGLSRVDFIPSPSDRPKGAIGTVGKGFEAFILVGEGVDSGQLANRFEKEILKEQGNASRLEAKLGNASFVSNAPEDVVAAEKSKLDELRRRIEKLSGYVADLR
ncbi:valine--tRNA ligase [Treponema zuelzerae]|uniref:Valine--tRNA ligase n=1 Tax=Teretinema zuelzerae TaxID=156 RepID=A0AAE3JJU4_9SPIR|nr:valine--tRNA ligase [Teretinema zuelzerae]MCD1653339.1 valine--tRNA ligase [Teretinema zuelzerae]